MSNLVNLGEEMDAHLAGELDAARCVAAELGGGFDVEEFSRGGYYDPLSATYIPPTGEPM